MTETQLHVLDLLRREGVPLTAREVREWAQVPSGMAILKQLERGGLVLRDEGYWRITEAGLSFLSARAEHTE